MKKIATFVSLIGLAAASLALSSCSCCTGQEPAPALRPAPSFAPIGEAPVDYAK